VSLPLFAYLCHRLYSINFLCSVVTVLFIHYLQSTTQNNTVLERRGNKSALETAFIVAQKTNTASKNCFRM